MNTVPAKHNPPWVSVVIPTLNEAKNLPYVLPKIPVWVHEVILVDGHSTDNTIQVAQELRPDVRVVEQLDRGKGAALRAGFAAAVGDIIVMLDADGSTDPAEIPAFVGVLRSGADFVKGSRFLQGGGTEDMDLFRRLGNWGLTQMVRLTMGGSFSDLCYGYNAFWKRVLPAINPDSNGFEVETAMNVRALNSGLKVAEIPSFEARRVHGESHLRAIPDGWRVLRTILKEWVQPQVPPNLEEEPGEQVAPEEQRDAAYEFPYPEKKVTFRKYKDIRKLDGRAPAYSYRSMYRQEWKE